LVLALCGTRSIRWDNGGGQLLNEPGELGNRYG
jgi:hypothetical protein